MNQETLIKLISQRTNQSTKQGQNFFNTFKEIVMEELAKGEDIKIAGFLHLARMTQDERDGVNPRTKMTMKIPAHFKVQTKIGKNLSQAVNKKRPSSQQLQEVKAKKEKKLKIKKRKIEVIEITGKNVRIQASRDGSRMVARINC